MKLICVFMWPIRACIEPEMQAQIFDRFIKLNTFVHGTGLGLSISKSIIEQLGGTIGVDSEPGKAHAFGLCCRLYSMEMC